MSTPAPVATPSGLLRGIAWGAVFAAPFWAAVAVLVHHVT